MSCGECKKEGHYKTTCPCIIKNVEKVIVEMLNKCPNEKKPKILDNIANRQKA